MDVTDNVSRRCHRTSHDRRDGVNRSQQIRVLVEHYENPRHRRFQERTDVAAWGGPEHGGSIVVYLKGNGHGGIKDVSFTGEGGVISVGATSVLMELVHDGGLTMDEVLALDNAGFVEGLGREVIGDRTHQATLGLSTLKHAVRTYQRDRLASGRAPGTGGPGEPSRSLEFSRRPPGRR